MGLARFFVRVTVAEGNASAARFRTVRYIISSKKDYEQSKAYMRLPISD